jgi:Virus neck protein
MGTNFYFNNWNASREQQLWEDLIIESIKVYGQDVMYLPRTIISYDDIMAEDDISQYNQALPIEMYIKSVDGFEGEGTFLSKFGLEIRDQVTFTVAKRIFEEEVGGVVNQTRPNEGDLIYFPLNGKLFQVKYVNYLPFFYQHGALQTYDLVCELFEYSSEQVATGIPEIDEVQTKFSIDAQDYAILAEDGTMLLTEDGDYITTEAYKVGTIDDAASNEEIQEEQEMDGVINWSEIDPFSETGNY